MSLAQNRQQFDQMFAADTFNFGSAITTFQTLQGQDRQQFELEAAKRGILFNENRAINQSQLQQRADEFIEKVTEEELTFDQELAFRQQLNAEEQQLWDIIKSNRAQLVDERNQQFQQDQIQFEDQFNINAQEFMQQFNMSRQQFHELIENTKVGGAAAAGLATNAVSSSNATAQLLAATGLAQGGVSIAQSQQMSSALTSIIALLRGSATPSGGP